MMNIIIFSGTTEGRIISEALSSQKIEHIVCVATEYGKEVMDSNEFAHIRTGRMNQGEMEELIKGHQGVVYDATHPYAVEVTDNIRQACENSNVQYIRVVREKTTDDCRVKYCQDMETMSKELDNTHGNILMTTGSKEIHKLKLSDMSRVYVRVIPSVDSINACTQAGIPVKNIIAMQGPFSKKMNMALIEEYHINYLVTKESGTTGGYEDKLAAASECGIDTYVLGRTSEEGMSVNEVLKMLGNKAQISLVGVGMGNKNTLTIEAMNAIAEAEIVFGPSRLIETVKDKKTYSMYRAQEILPVILESKCRKAVVLFSGDTGFYSGAAGFMEAAAIYKDNTNIKVIPGLSSVAYMAARTGVTYDDAFIFSIHGKGGADRYAYLKENVLSHHKSFVLLSGAEDVRLLGEMFGDKAEIIDITLGNRLSYEDERIIELTPIEAKEFDEEGLYIALISNSQPIGRKLIPYKNDEEFIRNTTPMTKAVVRHEIVRLLDISEGDVICDVGSGTGSVSIEIAALSPRVKVYALEQKSEAIEIMKQNMEKFSCFNIELIEGDALDTVETIPAVDAVFIGGSTGKMAEILKKLPRKDSEVRVVVTSVSMETLMDIYSLNEELDIYDMTVRQIAVTDVAKRGEHNLMQANNPVFVCSFRMK